MPLPQTQNTQKGHGNKKKGHMTLKNEGDDDLRHLEEQNKGPHLVEARASQLLDKFGAVRVPNSRRKERNYPQR
jgi:hypothetical protein